MSVRCNFSRLGRALILLPFLGMSSSISANDNPLIHEMVAAVSAERIKEDIQTLVDFGTRHTLSETQSDTRGIGAARRWIEAEFNAISKECGGCLEVITVSDFIEGEPRIPNKTEVVNVVAIQRGTRDGDRIIMMSGD